MSGLATVKGDIYNTLRTANLDVDSVVGFEPRELPPGITLTVSTGGVTAAAWLVVLRVYVPANLPPGPSQERLDNVLDTCLDVLPDYGPDEWQVEWDPDIAALVAVCQLEVPRAFED